MFVNEFHSQKHGSQSLDIYLIDERMGSLGFYEQLP